MTAAQITSPGVYADLTRADLPPGLSYSGAKDILRNPALYRWRRRHPKPPTAAMEFGSIVHALTLDTPQCWDTIDGGRGVTERRDAIRAAGRIPVTLDDLAAAARMAAAVWDHAEAAALLTRATRREVAAIGNDPDTGTCLRGFLDALHDGGRYAVDLKTGRDGVLDDFARAAVNFGYDVQAAAYHAVMEWIGQPIETVWFVVVESEPPHFVGIRSLDAEFVAMGQAKLRRALDTYAACVETGTWPGPAPVETVSAPRWALKLEGIS